MSYKVIHYFVDLQDNNYSYKTGDKFPRLGLEVSDKRIKELSTKNNKQGKPLIEEVVQDNFGKYMNEPQVDATYTKTEINRMSTTDLKALATTENIKNADKLNGTELKKVLIKHFNL